MAEAFDAIVIGTGQAAPALCARLDKEGLKTVLIERKLLGGTCVNVGCIPTKTLVASARAVHVARRGKEYGFRANDVRVSMPAVKRRKDAVVEESRGGLQDWLASMKTLTLTRGQARFVGDGPVIGLAPAVQRGEDRLDPGIGAERDEHPAAFLAALGDAGIAEDLDVAADARLALAQHLRQLAYRQLHRAEQREDAQPGRIG